MKFKTDNLVLDSDVLWDYPSTLYVQNKLFSSILFLFWRFCISYCRKRAIFDRTVIPNSLSILPQNYPDIIFKNSLTSLNRLFAFTSVYLENTENRNHQKFGFALFFSSLTHFLVLSGSWRGYCNLGLSLILLIYKFPWIVLWLVYSFEWESCG